MIRSLAIALALLVATPAAAADEVWWTDPGADSASPRLWYRLKPSFPEQGPWVFVRFDLVAIERDLDATPQPPPNWAWRATRVSLYLPTEESGEPRTVRQVADSESCAAIRTVMKRAGPALSNRFETDPGRKRPPLYVTDGVLVTVGAHGVFEPSSAPGTVAVSGNLNIAAADWAFDAEAALEPCWKPAP